MKRKYLREQEYTYPVTVQFSPHPLNSLTQDIPSCRLVQKQSRFEGNT